MHPRELPTARALAVMLGAASAVIALAGLLAEIAYATAPGDASAALADLLSLSVEKNIPTWFSSSLLLACGVLLAAVARRASAEGLRFAGWWWGLSAMFTYMSIDESVELHERLGGMVGTGGLLYFDWVIPAAALVLVLGLAYLPFLRALPSPTRARVAAAGLVYVGGALLMELPLGYWTAGHGNDNFTYAFIDWIEETMEIAGASLFLAAIADHYRRMSPAHTETP